VGWLGSFLFFARSSEGNPEYGRALDERTAFERSIYSLEHKIALKKQELLAMKFERQSVSTGDVLELAESITHLERKLRRWRQRDLDSIARLFSVEGHSAFNIDSHSHVSAVPDEIPTEPPSRSMVLHHWERLVSAVRGGRRPPKAVEPTGSAAARYVCCLSLVMVLRCLFGLLIEIAGKSKQLHQYSCFKKRNTRCELP